MLVFIILIIVGAVGIIGTLALTNGEIRAAEYGDQSGHPWYALHPENFESGLTLKVRTAFRNVLRTILIWMIKQYRAVSEKVTIKETVKRHVRGFLYDHDVNGERNPSEFWSRVRHPKKRKPTRKDTE